MARTSTLPTPCQNVVAAETAMDGAHVALLRAYVDNASEFYAMVNAGTTGLSSSTLSRWVAAFGFVTDIAEAHGEELLPLIVGPDLVRSLRSYDAVGIVVKAGEQVARATDPMVAAESAFRPMREACAARNARVKASQAKGRANRTTVRTADALSPVAFLSEVRRQADAILAAVVAGKVTVSDEDCAEIVALAAEVGPALARIVALAGSEEAPTLGTVATV